ncbi:MAG: type II toxin-antitoxin system HipA family toxin [Propionibacteriaceae bacterium]|nr:type II toxin-antitoxin system HipA family toxin [Propionibacteriaceae bacterium]
MGELTVYGRGGLATSHFTYEPEFLYGRDGFPLNNASRLDDEPIQTRGVPMFLEDTGPDRWGKLLLQREAHAAQQGPFDDLDYITGASDLARQGALRFKHVGGDEWLTCSGPPARLPLAELLHAADQVEADSADQMGAISELVQAGSTALGGARPKASVVEPDGRLWLAKFPMRTDSRNVEAWEKTALDLAAAAGIDVPRNRLVRIGIRDALLLARFDRDDSGDRIPYMSFRTMMNNPDDGNKPRADYNHIARFLRARTDVDLHAFFRRTTFSVMINNTDDHLRNMGLVRRGGSWHLSPMFDVNPEQAAGDPRHTPLSGIHTHIGLASALVTLGTHCGINLSGVRAHIDEVAQVIGTMPDVAAAHGLGEQDVNRQVAALETIRCHAQTPASS